MADVSWSRHGDEDCIRLGGVVPEAIVHVRAGTAGAVGEMPPMAGRLLRHGDDTCFVPRFCFLDGTPYTVLVDGVIAAVLVRPRPEVAATTTVIDIRPSSTQVPRNLLRFYVRFSAPMSEGQAAHHIRLVDEGGRTMAGALLPTEHELWDGQRQRLTVLLDPARIKRGLIGHREAGYPLRDGVSFRLVIDEGFRDALGLPLRECAERRYTVGGDERQRVDPNRWVLTVPPHHSSAPFTVAFDRPLDHGLLAHCLHVIGPDNRPVAGAPAIGEEERSWQFVPRHVWATGMHRLVVDAVLEDVAGNSVSRVFDRDLARAEDVPRKARPVTIAFQPR